MEPTEGTKSTPAMASHKKSLRLRGAGDTPNDGEASKCAKLSAMGFMWNGLPSTTLMEDIIYPLQMGLGSIVDRGSSLLEAIKQVDQGGVLANPSRAVCLASGNTKLIQNVEDSYSRDRRAFCVIMNYTDSKSSNYKVFMTEFNSSGMLSCCVSNIVLLVLGARTWGEQRTEACRTKAKWGWRSGRNGGSA